jgi:hypothetical protein
MERNFEKELNFILFTSFFFGNDANYEHKYFSFMVNLNFLMIEQLFF